MAPKLMRFHAARAVAHGTCENDAHGRPGFRPPAAPTGTRACLAMTETTNRPAADRAGGIRIVELRVMRGPSIWSRTAAVVEIVLASFWVFL